MSVGTICIWESLGELILYGFSPDCLDDPGLADTLREIYQSAGSRLGELRRLLQYEVPATDERVPNDLRALLDMIYSHPGATSVPAAGPVSAQETAAGQSPALLSGLPGAAEGLLPPGLVGLYEYVTRGVTGLGLANEFSRLLGAGTSPTDPVVPEPLRPWLKLVDDNPPSRWAEWERRTADGPCVLNAP